MCDFQMKESNALIEELEELRVFEPGGPGSKREGAVTDEGRSRRA